MIAIEIEMFEVVEEFKVPWGLGVGMVPLMRGSTKWKYDITTINDCEYNLFLSLPLNVHITLYDINTFM